MALDKLKNLFGSDEEIVETSVEEEFYNKSLDEL